MAGRRAAGEQAVLRLRHSGHSLVPRPWEQGYFGLPESADACVTQLVRYAALATPTITTRMGSGVTCNGCPDAY